MMAAAGAGGDKPYIDDNFNIYTYKGNATYPRTITNGIDFSGEGGLLIQKSRSDAYGWGVWDTERGAGDKALRADSNGGENSGAVGPYVKVDQFNSDGFRLNQPSSTDVLNGNNLETVAYSFRKAPGFFDVVTYTGNGSGRTIAHSLECIPGMIWVKRTDTSDDWLVYHRGSAEYLPNNAGHYYMYLNDTAQFGEAQSRFNNTAATSTVFSVGTDNGCNANGGTYVAYVFAGGESNASEATSCNFLGTSASGDYDNNKIFCGTTNGTKTADLVYGTGDFTWEAWVKCESSSNIYRRVFHHGQEWTNGTALGLNWDHNSNQNQFSLWSYNLSSSSAIVHSQTHDFDDDGQWHHVAVSRQSGTFRIFVDGILEGTNSSYSGSTESVSTNYLTIGATHNANVQECFKGNISNVRIVKGTAVYTSSFRPPTEPLTNITNTKLLCCNGSSVTSATVTPITLTVGDSSVTASTNSPFDDPAGLVFGQNEDQEVIKCGIYEGNGSSTGPVINLGWRPQFILIKRSSDSGNWQVWDTMRGIFSGGDAKTLKINTADSEVGEGYLDVTSTGFKITTTSTTVNSSTKKYIWMAIRSADGYVGKPAEVGTDAFNIGAGQNSEPGYIAGFPVEYAMDRSPTSGAAMYTGARLQGEYALGTHDNSPEFATSSRVFDFPTGWNVSRGASSPELSWMWKRGSGFDCVAYKGNGVAGRTLSHSLSVTPEMIWTKKRSSGNSNWMVWHKGLNGGGANAATWYLVLNENTAQTANSDVYGSTSAILPTSTNWTLGGNAGVNENGSNFLAMLFASVSGISSVGYYDGVDGEQTITTGFQPRFVIIKRISDADHWFVLDTTRGWGSGNDQALELDTTDAQSSVQAGAPTSTGFTVPALSGNSFAYGINGNGYKFVYYAHA